MGWLRASMRKTDARRSTQYRAWHPYDAAQALVPGARVEVDVNIWPTAWIIERGNRLVVEVGGAEQRGAGTFAHPAAGPWRPDGATPAVNGHPAASDVTLHTGEGAESYLVVPVGPTT